MQGTDSTLDAVIQRIHPDIANPLLDDPRLPPSLDRLGTGGPGDEGPSGSDSESNEAQRTSVADIIRGIGRDFVKLRQDGRSQAWAELEDRLMTNAYILIEAGLMNPKDWIGLAIDIEQFRKQEQGTHIPPGDFLRGWLSEGAVVDSVEVKEHKPKVAKKLEHKRSADAKRTKRSKVATT